MVNVIPGALLVLCTAHGNVPSISTALAATLTWRLLPFATNESITGIIRIIGGTVANLSRRRRDN